MLGLREMQESAALNFSASGNRVNCGHGTSLADLTAFTYWAWFYQASLVDFGVMLSKMVALGGDGKFICTRSNGSIDFRVQRATTNGTARSAAATIAAGVHTFVAGTYDETAGPRIYLGTQRKTAAETSYAASNPVVGVGATTADATWDQRIGTVGDQDTPGAGLISACGVLARVLNPVEMIALQFSALDEPNPAVMAGCRGLWYPGNDGPNTVIDYSGYHNDGTVTGATLSRGVALPAITDVTRMIG